jgi:hypothetical protein
MIIIVIGIRSVKYWIMKTTVGFQLSGSRCYFLFATTSARLLVSSLLSNRYRVPSPRKYKGGWNVTIQPYLIMPKNAAFTCSFCRIVWYQFHAVVTGHIITIIIIIMILLLPMMMIVMMMIIIITTTNNSNSFRIL